jgi:hypothetical protein
MNINSSFKRTFRSEGVKDEIDHNNLNFENSLRDSTNQIRENFNV